MNFKIILLFFWSFLVFGQEKPKYVTLEPKETQKKVQQFVTQFLNNYHYKKFQVNDDLSSKIFDNYLNDLDRSRNYFTKAEVESFEKYRYALDEAILNGDLQAPFEIFNLYREKYKIRAAYINQVLETGFDYATNRTIQVEEEEVNWEESEEAINKKWDDILLSQALNMKLSGTKDSAIVSLLKSRYDRFEKRISTWESGDAFQMFMNSFTEVIDPHTSYMIPSNADQFNIDMSQSLEGIGAVLQNENDYVMIKDIVPGGPLFKTKKASKNDYIVGVAQGEDGTYQDIVGWLTDDAVKLIRGKKGTTVRLQLLASDAPLGTEPREVVVVREKIKLEEAVATSEILEVENGKKKYRFGLIDIPMFYRDFASARNEKDFQSTTKDVKAFLDSYKNENIDGVIIDLRNNGGGSLTEAITLTGLFISEGPVVQRRTGQGKVDQENDADPAVTYNGPLLVLQNRFSASASEIFAGAIQDYNRGLILGEQSFGKGTVQQLVDLDRFLSSPRVASRNKNDNVGFVEAERYGQLKLTTEKFYRISGESTQRRGVIPHISFPTPWDSEETGESSRESALEYDVVRPASFSKSNEINDKVLKRLQSKYESLLKSNSEYKEIVKEIEEYKSLKERKEYSLNLEIRKSEKEESESNRNAIKKLNKTEKGDDRSEDFHLKLAQELAIELIGK